MTEGVKMVSCCPVPLLVPAEEAVPEALLSAAPVPRKGPVARGWSVQNSPPSP
jgi:hypothetical protein